MATTTKKAPRITKAMRNEDIIALLTGGEVKHGTTVEDAVKHLTRENEQLARKNSGDGKKLTKVQEENVKLKEKIIAFLTTQDSGVTATEVMNACELTSNQKAAALLRALADAGEVQKSVVKGKSLFTLSDVPVGDVEMEIEG